jgi:hypothetical protein
MTDDVSQGVVLTRVMVGSSQSGMIRQQDIVWEIAYLKSNS